MRVRPSELRILLVLLFGVFGALAGGSDLSAVPESEEAAQASKIIDAWFGARPQKDPKRLHVVYFHPRRPGPGATL